VSFEIKTLESPKKVKKLIMKKIEALGEKKKKEKKKTVRGEGFFSSLSLSLSQTPPPPHPSFHLYFTYYQRKWIISTQYISIVLVLFRLCSSIHVN